MSEGARGPGNRSARLLDVCAEPMERALGMRFVEEVTAGTIGDAAYADYLAIEESFVETAARLHGLAVWDAPDRTALERNARAVHALTTDQSDYFRAARAAWPVAARADAASPPTGRCSWATTVSVPVPARTSW
ncbi:hypothetical protein, partial [Actinoallomurus acaciae]